MRYFFRVRDQIGEGGGGGEVWERTRKNHTYRGQIGVSQTVHRGFILISRQSKKQKNILERIRREMLTEMLTIVSTIYRK